MAASMQLRGCPCPACSSSRSSMLGSLPIPRGTIELPVPARIESAAVPDAVEIKPEPPFTPSTRTFIARPDRGRTVSAPASRSVAVPAKE
ncbi:hypothetical protein SAMN05443248_3071 [Bradyrhizobium erythrophlei]|uniref:Uncharacterized protein n=1 Tax=Bradyrhizobium erythrophlei TaxID=1437360 RepID=A0A1M5NPK4_9BRAD|nr:hypothetical protein SAMN05443248_3071 [Bradyrhizobium erythrophlei]